MEIKTEDYRICYDTTMTTVSFVGSLRLSGPAEYAPIVQLLGSTEAMEPSKNYTQFAAVRIFENFWH